MSDFKFDVGQVVIWQRARRDWSSMSMVVSQYISVVKARKISEFGAVLYQGHDGVWFDEQRIVGVGGIHLSIDEAIDQAQ